MQVEMLVQDENVQTSPSDEFDIELQNISATKVVPRVADILVNDIVRQISNNVPKKTQITTTDFTKSIDEITQTSRNGESHEAEVEILHGEPYEMHIEASFVIPEVVKTSGRSEDQTEPFVVEIQKSFVVDETQPGLVREIESKLQEEVKKPKSSGTVKVQEKDPTTTHPTYATLHITKTTVYKTSNVISKEKMPHADTSVAIEEVLSDGNCDIPLITGNILYSKTREGFNNTFSS